MIYTRTMVNLVFAKKRSLKKFLIIGPDLVETTVKTNENKKQIKLK